MNAWNIFTKFIVFVLAVIIMFIWLVIIGVLSTLELPIKLVRVFK